MKLQPESKKELLRIACGTGICTAVMWAVFAVIHLIGWTVFDHTVILGGLVGAAVTVGNFAGMCMMLQKAIDEQDEKRRKARIQASYNARMLLQAAWVVIAIMAPCFQPFAGILPLLFPRVTIYYLQITGRYQPVTPAAQEETPAGEVPEGEDAVSDTAFGTGGSGEKGGEA